MLSSVLDSPRDFWQLAKFLPTGSCLGHVHVHFHVHVDVVAMPIEPDVAATRVLALGAKCLPKCGRLGHSSAADGLAPVYS
ncbi:hypothetical protein ACLKA7_006509 [Drosophila subpalustris]